MKMLGVKVKVTHKRIEVGQWLGEHEERGEPQNVGQEEHKNISAPEEKNW